MGSSGHLAKDIPLVTRSWEEHTTRSIDTEKIVIRGHICRPWQFVAKWAGTCWNDDHVLLLRSSVRLLSPSESFSAGIILVFRASVVAVSRARRMLLHPHSVQSTDRSFFKQLYQVLECSKKCGTWTKNPNGKAKNYCLSFILNWIATRPISFLLG